MHAYLFLNTGINIDTGISSQFRYQCHLRMYLYIYACNAPPVRYYAKLGCNNVIKYRFVFLKDIKVVEMTELELDFFMAQRWCILVHIDRTKLKIGRPGIFISTRL